MRRPCGRGYAACSTIEQMQTTAAEPVWLTLLERLYSGMKDLLVSLGHEFGRLNPAWSFTGETVAYLLRPDPRFDSSHEVTTWALFAEKGDHGERLLDGIAGKLTVERVPHGSGAVYPHPLAHGYLRTDDEFSTAVQHAFLAAMHMEARVLTFDFRWTLTFPGVNRVPLSGPSASLPFAASLVAAARKETLIWVLKLTRRGNVPSPSSATCHEKRLPRT
jgi:hypothetical protein